ncbi:MAG TPA: spore germination protein, partial [Clostridia bacterium]|nr:spore germination protein [Clostridia bacterium]
MKKLKPRRIKKSKPYEIGKPKKEGELGKISGPDSTGRLSHTREDLFKETYTKEELQKVKISPVLEENVDYLKMLLGNNNDFLHRVVGNAKNERFAVFSIDGLVDELLLGRDIIAPIQDLLNKQDGNITFDGIKEALSSTNTTEIKNMHQVVDSILYGSVPIIIDGEDRAVSVSVQKWQHRTPEEPINESVLRGPREGFVETLRDNTSLIRRRLRSPNLVIEEFELGQVTHTGVAMVYCKGIASPDLVQEVRSRLKRIRIDGILESNYIGELVADEFTIFPLIADTERPDRVVINLLEGRVAVLVDNTPIALVMPVTFTDFFRTPDDFYLRWPFVFLVKPLRYIAFIISLILPSLYVALTTFHQEMIPLDLLVKIASTREGVPFPAALEAIVMQLIFEILREAGVRLPKVVGSAVSIVGALIIGTASVDAGLVSPLMVIVVALTGISSFLSPIYSFTVVARLLVFPLVALAASFGLFGVAVGMMLILIHMLGLRSFGVPYLEPFSPFHLRDFADSFVSMPHWAMDKRPEEFVKENQQRQKPGLRPSPEK